MGSLAQGFLAGSPHGGGTIAACVGGILKSACRPRHITAKLSETRAANLAGGNLITHIRVVTVVGRRLQWLPLIAWATHMQIVSDYWTVTY